MFKFNLKTINNETKEKESVHNYLTRCINSLDSLSYVSHCGKYKNPLIKCNFVLTDKKYINDGYVYSQNTHYDNDLTYHNANKTSCIKMLKTKSQNDDKTMYEHMINGDNKIKEYLSLNNINFDDIISKFTIKNSRLEDSDNLLSQVFFPVNDSYELLTVLPPSSLSLEQTERISNMSFGNEDKKCYDYIRKISFTFGGSKPLNISYNCSHYASKYAIQSIPPSFKKRKIKHPIYDFFSENCFYKRYKDYFEKLHNEVYTKERNNQDVRKVRDNIEYDILSNILELVYKLRLEKDAWSDYTSLSNCQKIFLDNKYYNDRDEDVVKQFSDDFVHWFVKSYERNIDDSVILGDASMSYLQKRIFNFLECEVISK